MSENNIPIVMYHSVNDFPECHPLGFLSFSRQEFRQQLRCFVDNGFELVTLSDLLKYSQEEGRLHKSRYAVLTFDDGFLDNYLVATEIMEEFGAKGTIFVNPGHASEQQGLVRSINDIPKGWGYLSFDEMREIERQGVFEIESHTYTHEMIFSSDSLIDFYHPDKFDRYHWLVWMLYPETIKDWNGDVYRYKNYIPIGYPIFEYDRCLSGKAFKPGEGFVEQCIIEYKSRGSKSIESLNNVFKKGDFETDAEFLKRKEWQVIESKKILEKELGKTIKSICFPGGSYEESLLKMCATAGYELYMLSSKTKLNSNNIESLTTSDRDVIVGLKRIGFSKNYPAIFESNVASYWNVKIKIGSFMNESIYRYLLVFVRFIRRLTRTRKKSTL